MIKSNSFQGVKKKVSSFSEIFLIPNHCITSTRLTVGMSSWGGEFCTRRVAIEALSRLSALWDNVTLIYRTAPSLYSFLHGKEHVTYLTQ